LDVLVWYYRVDPRRIVLIKSLLEGYEGLVVVRTEDPQHGALQLLVSPDFAAEMEGILADISQRIWMERLPAKTGGHRFQELVPGTGRE
jgi:hypothetical protein